MRVLAIVPSVYDTNPSQRFRIEQWEPLLRARGVEVTFRPFESRELHAVLYKPGRTAEKLRLVAEALRRRAADVRAARDYDAVYLLREAALLGPPLFERWLRRTGVPFVATRGRSGPTASRSSSVCPTCLARQSYAWSPARKPTITNR